MSPLVNWVHHHPRTVVGVAAAPIGAGLMTVGIPLAVVLVLYLLLVMGVHVK